MYLYAKLFGVLYGGVRKIRFCQGQLADVKKTVSLRALGQGRVRPHSHKHKRANEMARIGID